MNKMSDDGKAAMKNFCTIYTLGKRHPKDSAVLHDGESVEVSGFDSISLNVVSCQEIE